MTSLWTVATSRARLARRNSVLLLSSALFALASAGGTATGTVPLDRPAPWMLRAQGLLGALPISVSVAEGGRVVFAHIGNLPRPPASNEKLLLSMALLDHFGPAFRIATTVEGPPPRAGAVAGDLWLVGHGDPDMNDATLARLARALRAAGVRSVHGSVIGVADTFTRERWASGWHRIALQFVALPTALVFDANSGPDGYVFDPERRAATLLTADLRALGVRVRGRATAGHAPARAQAVLASVRSAPLVDILRRQNLDSLNLDAEVLTKLLGAAVFEPPGSIAKGARAIQRWARQHGVRLVAHDGSGLSYTDSISSNAMVRLLAAASRRSWGSALRSTLPAGGQGTLARRLLGLRVRAKTGTLLEQVSALSGWVWLQNSRRWAEFSILSRGLPKPQSVAVEDRILAIIAKQA